MGEDSQASFSFTRISEMFNSELLNNEVWEWVCGSTAVGMRSFSNVINTCYVCTTRPFLIKTETRRYFSNSSQLFVIRYRVYSILLQCYEWTDIENVYEYSGDKPAFILYRNADTWIQSAWLVVYNKELLLTDCSTCTANPEQSFYQVPL
jgi:hypothetical protein